MNGSHQLLSLLLLIPLLFCLPLLLSYLLHLLLLIIIILFSLKATPFYLGSLHFTLCLPCLLYLHISKFCTYFPYIILDLKSFFFFFLVWNLLLYNIRLYKKIKKDFKLFFYIKCGINKLQTYVSWVALLHQSQLSLEISHLSILSLDDIQSGRHAILQLSDAILEPSHRAQMLP